MSINDITPDKGSTPTPCKHILIPGRAHCEMCGDQILYTGLERTRWQRFTAWVAAWFHYVMADNNSTTLPARRIGSVDPQE